MDDIPEAPKKHYLRYIMLIYVIVIGSAVIVWNRAEGNLIQDWVAHGEGKLRVGRDFAAFTWLFGGWIYLFAPISALPFFQQAWEEKRRQAKIDCIVRACTSLFFFAQFLILDVGKFISMDV